MSTVASPSAAPEMRAADRELLDRTMAPYVGKRAVYLTDATVDLVDGEVVAHGWFSIAEPCYIDDTGHFNAVESLICYNQLMYYALARVVRDGLVAEMAHWTLDQYWERQLPDVLIYRQAVRYRRPIASTGFRATFRIRDVDTSALDRGMLRVATTVDFADDTGGAADGEVALTLVNVPPAP